MAHVTTLMQEKDEATRKLQRTEISCDHFQQLLDDARKAAETTQKAIVSRPRCSNTSKLLWKYFDHYKPLVAKCTQDCDRFVLVLIDGDVTLVRPTSILLGDHRRN